MKEKFLVFDIETLNSTEDAIAYDIGFVISDRSGFIYEKASFLVYETFVLEKDLMNSCYYAKKIPQYKEGLEKNEHFLGGFLDVMFYVRELIKNYNIKYGFAYNANFDKTGLNRSVRYITKSKFRYFFPKDFQVFCIWHIACQTIFCQKKFFKFAIENNLISKSGNLKTSAEVAYKYITKDENFEEEHKGLDDTLIELQILLKCFAQHKKMNKSINRLCWRIPTQEFKKFYKISKDEKVISIKNKNLLEKVVTV